MNSKNAFFIVCCCLVLSSCTVYQQVVTVVSEPAKIDPEVDTSCSYFYFLWGSHAEFTERYAEALEAYEKALICDPRVSYVRGKIPILLLKMGEVEKAAEWLRQAMIEDPEENSNRLFLASLSIQQDRIAEAINLYNDVLKREPDNETVHLRLGLLYSHQEEYKKAEKIFRDLVKKNDKSYYAHLSLARLLYQTEKFDGAASEYGKALELNWSKELAFEIGHFFIAQKRFPDALRLFTKVVDSDPFDERAGLSRAQALLDMEKNDEALEQLRTISTFSKNPSNIDIIISKVLLRKDEVEKAKVILERLAKENFSSEPRYMLALIAYKNENFTKALEHLSLILPGNPEFEEAVYLQTRILKQAGDIDQAVGLLKKHIVKDKSRSPLFYALLSSFYQELGQNLEAISLMEAAVTLYPDNSQLFFEYGLLLDKNNMEKQAMEKMAKVLELRPDHAEALNFIGYTWADQNINLKQALDYIEKAVAQKPNNGYIVDSLGWVYFRLGDFARAAKELERSLTLEPGDPHIYDHLGDVYRSLEKSAEALQMYLKALELFTDEKKKEVVKEKINALEKK